VQGRRTVQHDRMFSNDVFEDVPYHRLLAFDHLLGLLDGGGVAENLQLVENEGLEQLQSHQLGQAALMQLELRADHDDRAARVVDALTQKVLTETTALALDHVGQRLERTLVGTGHRLATATVVEQRVDGFLKHALFVAHDDFRGLKFEQALQTVVTVDDTTIEVVEVGGREAAAVQRHQRTQVRRQDRQHLKDHPVRLDTRLLESLKNLQTLGQLLVLGFGTGDFQFCTQGFNFAIQFEVAEQFANTLGPHQGLEFITMLFDHFKILVFSKQLAALEVGDHARVGNDISFEIQDALDIAQRHV